MKKLDIVKLNYTVVYHCITKQRTNALYQFKKYVADNPTAIKYNKASDKAEKKFLELATKCGWYITSDIEWNKGE